MRKRWGLLIVLLIASGCGKEEQAKGNYSNYYAEGTKIFEIDSKPLSEAIAVETADHRYVEAVAFP